MPSPRLAHDTRVLGSVLGLPKGRAEVASLRRLEMMAVSDDSGSRKKNDPGALMGKAVSAFAGPLSADWGCKPKPSEFSRRVLNYSYSFTMSASIASRSIGFP